MRSSTWIRYVTVPPAAAALRAPHGLPRWPSGPATPPASLADPRPGAHPQPFPSLPLGPPQVKMEFSNKPEIYNEFLEIMKQFKAQEYVGRSTRSPPLAGASR